MWFSMAMHFNLLSAGSNFQHCSKFTPWVIYGVDMLINAWGTPDPDENNIDPFQAKLLPTHELGDVVFL